MIQLVALFCYVVTSASSTGVGGGTALCCKVFSFVTLHALLWFVFQSF